jgi:hypothetical protein
VISGGGETDRFIGTEYIGPSGTEIVGTDTRVRGTQTDVIEGTEDINGTATTVVGTDTFTGPDGKQTTIVGTETIVNGTTVASGTEWVDGVPTPISDQTLANGTVVGTAPSLARTPSLAAEAAAGSSTAALASASSGPISGPVATTTRAPELRTPINAVPSGRSH